MERLAAYAGIKTKREFVSNALTLFRWAANEMLYGRSIASIGHGGAVVKQLEMPCLTAFAHAGAKLNDRLTLAEFAEAERPSKDELTRRASLPGRDAREVLAEMRVFLDRLTAESETRPGQ